MEEKIDNLTKDVGQLTNLVDQLAISMVKGFESSANEFTLLKNEMKGIEERLSHKIDSVNNRIDDIALVKATKEDLKNLDTRVTKIEEKVLV